MLLLEGFCLAKMNQKKKKNDDKNRQRSYYWSCLILKPNNIGVQLSVEQELVSLLVLLFLLLNTVSIVMVMYICVYVKDN